jgi:hypothetical protein
MCYVSILDISIDINRDGRKCCVLGARRSVSLSFLFNILPKQSFMCYASMLDISIDINGDGRRRCVLGDGSRLGGISSS